MALAVRLRQVGATSIKPRTPGALLLSKNAVPARALGARAFVVTLVAAALAGASAATPAWAADGFALRLSAPTPAVVGQPLAVTADGKNPDAADYPYPTYLDVDLFRTGVVTTCPSTVSAAGQLAEATEGALLAFDVQIATDQSGNFSIPVGLTPPAPGAVLLCGYTAGLAGETLASASLTLPVRAAATGRPRSLTAPHVRRSGGRLICDTGRWSNAPTRFSFAWRVDGRARRGAAGRTLAITRALRGHRVQCGVTASNGAGRATALSQRFAVR
jgi:hypothetical protein